MYRAIDIMDTDTKHYYGWFDFHPPCIQIFKSIRWAVFFISMGALIQGVAVNGFLHYFIPMIERHFQLSSTKAGFMSGAYDIASLICLIPVTYYGGQKTSKKPLYLGTGVLILGTGSFIFALPAFFAGHYRYGEITSLCIEHIVKIVEVVKKNYTFHYILLVIGNFLHGVGASPLFTLGITFIDENAPPHKSSIYLGIFYMMAILGPCLGYLIGGYLANIYVDITITETIRPADLRPDNPNWVGCWWLGFLGCAVASLIFAIPILGYPRTLKEQPQANNSSLVPQNFLQISALTVLPNAIFRVIRRLKFNFITCAGFCEGIVISGMGSFFPKLLEQQMGCSSQTTAIILGGFAVPCALVGIMIGGWVIKHFLLKLDQLIMFCLIMVCFATITSLGLFLSCPTAKIAGFHISYPTQEEEQLEKSLFSECNKNCHCKPDIYDPVCGVDDINYFNPCFAGCISARRIDRFTYYFGCKCIKNNGTKFFDAKQDICPVPCPVFYVFTVSLCLYQVFTFSCCVPALAATLRSVEEELKSLAMGIQWIVARLLGTIPGPVMFGIVFDKACVLWYNSHTAGVCLLYDHWILSLYIGGIVVFFKCLEALFFILAYSIRSDVYKNV